MPHRLSCGPFTRGVAALAFAVALALEAVAQEGARPFEPEVGQPGKDVVWVPTPPALVEKMLDLAQVTRDDYVTDLGTVVTSGRTSTWRVRKR